jgi:DNA-binding CsgD family transcriptional regulator
MAAPTDLRIASPVMVGREAELALIGAALDTALEGRPRVVLVGGEAGIGKSRLVAEAVVRARPHGPRVLRGGCLTLAREIPYLPFAEMLRALARELPADARTSVLGPAADELALVVPGLARARVPGLAPAGAVASGSRLSLPVAEGGQGLARLRLFEGLLGVTERLAAEAPVVAVIEDIQWADEASLGLLSYLVHSLRRGRVMSLITMRAEEMERAGLDFIAELEREDGVERIELAGLSAAQTGAQMAAILGRRPERPLVDRVHALSGGNPFYAEEVLAAERAGSMPDPAGSGGQPGVSLRLRDILRARTERLPPDARSVLRVAAMSQGVVDGRLLAQVAGMSTERLEDGIRAVIDEGLLVRVAPPEGPGYRFRHELARAFVASEVLPTESARLHAAFADRLVSTPTLSHSPAELAHHWEAAGDMPMALPAHVEAGLWAEDAFAFEVAHRHLERALDLWDQVPNASDRVSMDRPHIVAHAADAAANAGTFDRAIELAERLLSNGAGGSSDLRAYVRSRMRWYLWQAGRTDEALVEAQRAVESLAGGEPDRWRANAIAHLAGLRLLTGHVTDARRSASEAIAMAVAVGASEEEALARGVLGWCLVHSGRVGEGIDQIRAVWVAAQAGSSPRLTGIALAHGQLASVLEIGGRATEAVEAAASGADWSRAHGMERTFGRVLDAVRARSLYHLGRWAEANDVVASGLDLDEVGPGTLALQVDRALLGAGQGRDEEVADVRARVAARLRLDVTQEPVGWLVAALAEHALWHGDHGGALAWLGWTPPDEAVLGAALARALESLATLHWLDASYPRRMALAARAIAEAAALARAGRVGSAVNLGQARAAIGSDLRRLTRRGALASAWRPDLRWAAAELSRAAAPGSPDEVRAWERAAASAAERGRPYVEGYARWRLAEALLAGRHDRPRATAALTEALATARGLGAAPLARELELLALRARVTLAGGEADASEERVEAPTPFGLTSRELEVLALLAAGDTNREIGERLFISPRTASVHVANILGKMGVDGRVEAAALAVRLGVAPDVTGR